MPHAAIGLFDSEEGAVVLVTLAILEQVPNANERTLVGKTSGVYVYQTAS